LDELPQLYNILVGDMSFVGPRPLLSLDQPNDKAPRLSVRPGLTGMAQAYGERSMPPDDKNTLDIWYIQNASLWLDLKIVLRTMMVLIRGEFVDKKMLHMAEGTLRRLRIHDATGPLVSSVVEKTGDETVRAVG
jgi:lipopolysaccharide/colanic/teichoic acid biosynthesis glycosyltransferase